MSILDEFEFTFQKQRQKWTKAEWRYVAEFLSKKIPVKNKAGRPKNNKEKADNTPAAEFWVQQEQNYKAEILNDKFHKDHAPDVYKTEVRKERMKRSIALINIVKEASARTTEGRELKTTVRKKAKSLERLLQTAKKQPKKI